nr:extracellular solute-binding protein [Clostridia bacterium]
MMKKLSACLAAILTLSLFLVAYAEDLSEVGTYPIAKETTPLSILMQQDVLVEDYDTNAFTKWVEETCNVDLRFDLLPAGSDGTDKLALMLSSGQKLPDVINMGMSTLQDYIYGSTGIFTDLTDYYKTSAYYINQRMEEYPQIDLLGPVTVADGKIYCIPRYYNETIGLTNKRLWMNMEFLSKLGLEVPTTTEEFYQVL